MKSKVIIIKELRSKIKKLETDFKRGVPPYQGFTIDISYGGNTDTDIEKVCIGSVSDDKEAGELFYNLVLSSLKNSLKFWEDSARAEISELTILLSN